MTQPAPDSISLEAWRGRLVELCDELRTRTRGALKSAFAAGRRQDVDRPVGVGVGDATFGLDVPAEAAIHDWAHQVAAGSPLSILTEDTGWRHLGPDGSGGVADLPGFDHGGPRIAVDPVDGTRNMMADLRSAWTVIGLAGPGPGLPRQSEVLLGLVSELPTRLAARARRLWAERGGAARIETFEIQAPSSSVCTSAELRTDDDDRVDHGYFSFFRYLPRDRPALARLEADFFARLERDEAADVKHCYDDQYISNAGQLVLTALGTYRMMVDVRAHLAHKTGLPSTTSKPYDISGALLVAAGAGCEITDSTGAALDFPLDAETPLSFIAYVNRASRRRLEPHLLRALDGDWAAHTQAPGAT